MEGEHHQNDKGDPQPNTHNNEAEEAEDAVGGIEGFFGRVGGEWGRNDGGEWSQSWFLYPFSSPFVFPPHFRRITTTNNTHSLSFPHTHTLSRTDT